MKTYFHLMGTKIDTEVPGWSEAVMAKIDDAKKRGAINDMSAIAYSIHTHLVMTVAGLELLDDYRGHDYGDDSVDDDEDVTIPRARIVTDLLVPPGEGECQHPNMGYSPDQYKNGVRVSKHHWWCADCSYVQVG